MDPQKHDFFQHMASLRRAIARDFELVKKRSKEDPGTAGDQVEEQWAEVLRNWLPATFPVITKGRILFEDGSSSPQVDVLVLKPSYPLALRKQKHIFAGGILAAFECKLTLRATDVRDAFETSSMIKRKSRQVMGTPFDELCKLPLFGVLAHSHNMKTKTGESRLYDAVEKYQTKFASHSSEMIDVICVAEEATIPLSRHVIVGPDLDDSEREQLDDEDDGLVSTMYVIHEEKDDDPVHVGAVLAGFVHDLTWRIAFHEPSIRDWSDHLSYLGFYGGIGRPVYWTAEELSAAALKKLRKNGRQDEPWSKWSKFLP